MSDIVRILLTIAVLSFEAKVSRGVEKYWLPDVEWESSSNWLGGLMPETDSQVIFPLEMRHAIGMPRNADFRLSGMDLSRDGIVALPENGKIVVSDRKESRGRESHWLRDTPFFWVDPQNWNGSSEATPHLERLPCQSDLVVLPPSSQTFSVRLPVTRELEVRGVRLADGNRSLSRWAWRDMAQRAEFLGDWFSVKYSPLECENCPCQEGDMSEYWEEVCSVQRPRCGLLACENPLKVEGHCCFYCGGRIRLSKKTLLSTVQRVANSVLKKYEDTLFWYSRLTWDGESEILITEKGTYEGTNTIIAIFDVKAALKEERVEVLYSETSGDALKDYRLALTLGPFFGGFVVLFLLFLILFPLFGYTFSQVWEACVEASAAICLDRRVGAHKKKKKRKSFAFARFENISEGNVQLAEETEPNLSSLETFENPLYRNQAVAASSGRSRDKKFSAKEPVSLAALEKAIELDRMEDVEMDIENL